MSNVIVMNEEDAKRRRAASLQLAMNILKIRKILGSQGHAASELNHGPLATKLIDLASEVDDVYIDFVMELNLTPASKLGKPE